MSTFLFIVAGGLALLTLLGLISAIKNRDASAGFISVIFLFIAFVPAYFGYMQMDLVGTVEYVDYVKIGKDEFGTMRYKYTATIRNKDGGQDTIVWTGIHNDERYADAKAAVNPEVDNTAGDARLFEYKRCEIQ